MSDSDLDSSVFGNEPTATQPSVARLVRARVFVTKDGNRFLIPGYWYSDDDPDLGLGSASACLLDGMMIGVVCGFKSEEWLEIHSGPDGVGEIAHIPYRMTGRQFAHGAVDVLLIGGPLFDEEMTVRTIEPEPQTVAGDDATTPNTES